MAGLHLSYVRPTLGLILVTAAALWGAPGGVPGARSDAEVVRVFRGKLAKSKLAGEGIEIKVEHGVATLTGKTEIVQHKGTATRMAKSSGATEVRNRIVVSDAARKSAGERLSAVRSKNMAVHQPARNTSPAASQPGTPGQTKPTGAAASEHVPPPVRRAVIKH